MHCCTHITTDIIVYFLRISFLLSLLNLSALLLVFFLFSGRRRNTYFTVSNSLKLLLRGEYNLELLTYEKSFYFVFWKEQLEEAIEAICIH